MLAAKCRTGARGYASRRRLTRKLLPAVAMALGLNRPPAP
jgi:hypothetical protein